LPEPLTRLVGREREVQAVKESLGAVRLVNLTGTGGIGKTRLALQAAAEIATELPDGACFVELAALTDPSLVTQAAAALGIQEEPGRPLLRTLRDALRPRMLLLVLDNCEHLLANAASSPAGGDAASNCAELVETLLRGCRHLRVLATSREPLGLPGEVLWRVPPLSLPPPESLETIDKETVAELMSYEAVRLFVKRAVESRPDFTRSPANLQAAGRICRQLDGIRWRSSWQRLA
jgi:non-specific serine/threonine protein kinase